jgi:hypothetical protein
MNPKFLVLYIIAGSLSLILSIYQLVTSYDHLDAGRLALNVFMTLFFYYLAYKTYHEKKDKELM